MNMMDDSIIYVSSNPNDSIDNKLEVINFEDFLSETTNENSKAKRKRISDADAVEKKKKKISNQQNTLKIKDLKSISKQTSTNVLKTDAKALKKSKKKNVKLKSIKSATENIINKSSSDEASSAHATKTVYTNNTVTKKLNKNILPKQNGKPVQERKIRKSSSDGIAEVQIIKKASNPHVIPKLCRTPNKQKMKNKKILTEAPLKNESILWSEKYAPKSCEHILGKTDSIKKLNHWLQEWKKYVDKEILVVEAKKNKSYDSDDDFQLEGSEKDEANKLCNTMLLLGPSGCGKTTAVYTCAQALGFKVNEMNASTVREKKQVLSQLHEATQSHQLAKENIESGIKSFFQQVKKNKKSNGEKSDAIEKRLCLVLLEEVDILYEDDKFFWTAVQTLTSTSKRPIILTSNDLSVASYLEDNFEKLTFRAPSTTTLCKHMKMIDSKEHSTLTADSDLYLTVEFMRNDIRRSIHALHFWTGGIKEITNKKKRRSFKKLSMMEDNVQLLPKKTFLNSFLHVTGVENIPPPHSHTNEKNFFKSIKLLPILDHHSDQILYLQNCLYHLHMHRLPWLISLNWDLFLDIEQPKPISGKPLKIKVDATHTIPDIDNESYDLLKLAHGDEKRNLTKVPIITYQQTKVNDGKLEPIKSGEQSHINDLKVISKLWDSFLISDMAESTFLKASDKTYGATCKLLDDLDKNTGTMNSPVSYKMESSNAEVKSLIDLYAFSMCQKSLKQSKTHNNCINPTEYKIGTNIWKQKRFCSSMQNLFDSGYNTHITSFALDTMPAIRSICRAQDNMQKFQLKRRFLHYFSTLLIHPKPHQILKLSTDFSEVPLK